MQGILAHVSAPEFAAAGSARALWPAILEQDPAGLNQSDRPSPGVRDLAGGRRADLSCTSVADRRPPAPKKGIPLTAPAPLLVHREIVTPDYVDYNGHLNDGYYLVIFSHATTAMMDHIALGEAERTATGHTLFSLEMHINYMREVKLGAEVRVAVQILGRDQKRLHFFHSMFEGPSGEPVATNEQMQVNYDMRAGRTVPFLPEVQAKIDAIIASQAGLAIPANVGRVIGLPKKA
jgi:acyl-CoA thioester hydrolase